MQNYFAGIFPRDNPKNTRFAINFFTCIGLGGLTYANLFDRCHALLQECCLLTILLDAGTNYANFSSLVVQQRNLNLLPSAPLCNQPLLCLFLQ